MAAVAALQATAITAAFGCLWAPVDAASTIVRQQPLRFLASGSPLALRSLSQLLNSPEWRQRCLRAMWMRVGHNALLGAALCVAWLAPWPRLLAAAPPGSAAASDAAAPQAQPRAQRWRRWGAVAAWAALPVVCGAAALALRTVHTILVLDLNHGYKATIQAVRNALHYTAMMAWRHSVRERLTGVLTRGSVFTPGYATLVVPGLFAGWRQSVPRLLWLAGAVHPMIADFVARVVVVNTTAARDASRGDGAVVPPRSAPRWCRAVLRIAAAAAFVVATAGRNTAVDAVALELSSYRMTSSALVAPPDRPDLEIAGSGALAFVADLVPIVVAILATS